MVKEIDSKDEYFKAIKKRYRKGPIFEKLKKVGGKPNWDNIRNYTIEELRLLLLLGAGKTIQQEEACKEHYNSRIFDLPSDWYKQMMKSCWKDFAHALGDREVLKDALEKEENLQKVYKMND